MKPKTQPPSQWYGFLNGSTIRTSMVSDINWVTIQLVLFSMTLRNCYCMLMESKLSRNIFIDEHALIIIFTGQFSTSSAMASKSITRWIPTLLSWRKRWNCWHISDPTCKRILSKLALLFHQEKATNLSDCRSCDSGSVLLELLLCTLPTERYRYNELIVFFSNNFFWRI